MKELPFFAFFFPVHLNMEIRPDLCFSYSSRKSNGSTRKHRASHSHEVRSHHHHHHHVDDDLKRKYAAKDDDPSRSNDDSYETGKEKDIKVALKPERAKSTSKVSKTHSKTNRAVQSDADSKSSVKKSAKNRTEKSGNTVDQKSAKEKPDNRFGKERVSKQDSEGTESQYLPKDDSNIVGRFANPDLMDKKLDGSDSVTTKNETKGSVCQSVSQSSSDKLVSEHTKMRGSVSQSVGSVEDDASVGQSVRTSSSIGQSVTPSADRSKHQNRKRIYSICVKKIILSRIRIIL